MTKIIIIPGNPPASYFYEAWKQELKHITHHDVLIDYYPSFNHITCSQKYLEKIEDFYADQIQNHEKIILIGHSIGGHIALKLLEKYPEKIDRCVLLFPFLHSPGIKGKLMLSALHQINKRAFLKARRFKMLKLLSYLDQDINKLNIHEIDSSLSFAFHEHKTMVHKKNININPDLCKKITLYYTNKDTWCSKKVVRKLHPEMHKTFTEINHNFVTSPEQRQKMNHCLFRKPHKTQLTC
ncbi:MAG: alpha/beta fold hydrolase [Legionellaceae bacterium]|nr:alpha/beta fold hydrolase [Legionellaceae bacterium]